MAVFWHIIFSLGSILPSLAYCQNQHLGFPDQAQSIDQKLYNVLGMEITDEKSLTDKPFHVYDEEFLDIIGQTPSLTVIATSDTDPIFHEAVVWHQPKDEMFFVQHAGHPDTGTGLNKSAIIQKISMQDALDVEENSRNGSRQIPVTTISSNPQVINPNGGANFRGGIVFAGEGQGTRVRPALYLMNPEEPFNTTILVDNYHGREFNSINDVAVNNRNQDVYFTDPGYGYLLGFRPEPRLPNQVYRFNAATGAISVVADGFALPNGIGFSPEGLYAYVTDTGVNRVKEGMRYSDPATIYRFTVDADGTFKDRRTFAYVVEGIPDGVHCDSKGNVYVGCEDGIHVWNPSGKLIGKIFTGITCANFQFAGQGRMLIMGETKLFYATLAASGSPLS